MGGGSGVAATLGATAFLCAGLSLSAVSLSSLAHAHRTRMELQSAAEASRRAVPAMRAFVDTAGQFIHGSVPVTARYVIAARDESSGEPLLVKLVDQMNTVVSEASEFFTKLVSNGGENVDNWVTLVTDLNAILSVLEIVRGVDLSQVPMIPAEDKPAGLDEVFTTIDSAVDLARKQGSTDDLRRMSMSASAMASRMSSLSWRGSYRCVNPDDDYDSGCKTHFDAYDGVMDAFVRPVKRYVTPSAGIVDCRDVEIAALRACFATSSVCALAGVADDLTASNTTCATDVSACFYDFSDSGNAEKLASQCCSENGAYSVETASCTCDEGFEGPQCSEKSGSGGDDGGGSFNTGAIVAVSATGAFLVGAGAAFGIMKMRRPAANSVNGGEDSVPYENYGTATAT